MRWQVCARTAALPPVTDEYAADNVEPGAPLPLKATRRQGRRATRMTPRQGSSPRHGLPPRDSPRDGGVAAGHGAGRACGQVLLLGPGGAGRPGGAAPGGPHPAGVDFPLAQRRHRPWGLQDHGTGSVPAPGGEAERTAWSPPPLEL